MAKQPKPVDVEDGGITTEPPLPISHPTVVPVALPVPQSIVVRCEDCVNWRRLNQRASVGECGINSRFSHGPVLTTDLVTCSLAKAAP